MEQGLLWFDNSNRTLTEKIKIVATGFQRKYGRTPNLVLVNPGMMTEDVTTVAHYGVEIHVRPYRPVLPGHLWVGIDEEPEYVRPIAEANAGQERERAEMQEIKAAAAQGVTA